MYIQESCIRCKINEEWEEISVITIAGNITEVYDEIE
jgi:hypothetical protein